MKIIDEQKVREKFRKLTFYLIENGITVSTMESATSGQLASLITDTEGASAVFKGAFVTYCNEAKIKAGVPAEIINRFSVYSNETADEMAKTCSRYFETELGIGITGTFGNVDPANDRYSEPGVVYYSFYYKEQLFSFCEKLVILNSRYEYKLAISEKICDRLMKVLGE